MSLDSPPIAKRVVWNGRSEAISEKRAGLQNCQGTERLILRNGQHAEPCDQRHTRGRTAALGWYVNGGSMKGEPDPVQQTGVAEADWRDSTMLCGLMRISAGVLIDYGGMGSAPRGFLLVPGPRPEAETDRVPMGG